MDCRCNLLSGKRGLIIGVMDEWSLAWHVAKRCIQNGAVVVLSATDFAMKLGCVNELAEQENLHVIPCDLTKPDEIADMLDMAQKLLDGRMDFVLHSVAMSENLRRNLDYDKMNYNYYAKTLDVSAFSLHKLLRCAMEMDAIAEGGSVVTLTYIASERYVCGYNDMADAKALLESIVRQMGAIYGKNKGVRVNAISQSAVPTKAGKIFNEMDYFYSYTDDLSPLGLADADDCADTCVALFSDLMRKVTMQTIYNDGGFSRTMLTTEIKDSFRKIEQEKRQTK